MGCILHGPSRYRRLRRLSILRLQPHRQHCHIVGHDAHRLDGHADGEGPSPNPQPPQHRGCRASVVYVKRQAKLACGNNVWARSAPIRETPNTFELFASHAVTPVLWSVCLQITGLGRSRLHTAWRRRPRNRRLRHRHAGSDPPG